MKDRTGQKIGNGDIVALDFEYLSYKLLKMTKQKLVEELTIPSVPVIELKWLHDQMGEIEYQTDRERNILWSCQAMLLDCIESYEGSDAE